MMSWCLLLLSIGLVWVAESLNTAIEELADFVHADNHSKIGKIKDISASGVLIAACLAGAVGIMVLSTV